MTQTHPSLHVEMFIIIKSFRVAGREDNLSRNLGKDRQQLLKSR